MKDMIKRIREEKGGFTLAELLIVVAIVMVLVAIAIPVFTGSLENAKTSVAAADLHAAKSQAGTMYLSKNMKGSQKFIANVSKDGDITVASSGDAATGEDSDTVEEVKGKMQDDNSAKDIVVVITAEDVSK